MNDKSVQTQVGPSVGMPEKVSSFDRFWQWLINWPFKVEQDIVTPQLLYYTPGKVLWHIERPNNPSLRDEQLAQDIREFLRPTEQEIELKEPEKDSQRTWQSKLLPPDPDAIITFPPKAGSTSVLSVVPLLMTDQKASTNELETLLIEIDASLQGNPLIIHGDTKLHSVSPDWLIGGAGHGGPHPPSPGSWPLQAPTPSPKQREIWLIQDKPNQTPQQNTIGLPFSDGKGHGIDVAIPDTAPLQISRKEAYDRWKSDPLVSDLLRPNGNLTVHTGINADVELADYHPVGHRYHGMENHGLFVAGIIHNIAPDANLYLFKAFSSHGSGSCESIAGAIKKILQMFRNPNDTPEQKEKWRPLIVNCSFSLKLNDDNPDLSDKIKAMRKLFEELFKQLTDEKKVIVIAAAGNYINDPKNPVTARPPTDYPAAFKNVLAIGALPKASSITPTEFKAATYSNRSNNNDPDEGFMAFGGEPGDGNGVQGLYISEFPAYNEGWFSFLWRLLTGTGLDGWKGPGHIPPDPKGLHLNRIRYKEPKVPYAWWAGTSCAAPHITGIVANWCSQPAEFRAPDEAHQSINIENVKWALHEQSQRRTTDIKEQVIFIVQGPPPP